MKTLLIALTMLCLNQTSLLAAPEPVAQTRTCTTICSYDRTYCYTTCN